MEFRIMKSSLRQIYERVLILERNSLFRYVPTACPQFLSSFTTDELSAQGSNAVFENADRPSKIGHADT